jgi:hypothetical protein
VEVGAPVNELIVESPTGIPAEAKNDQNAATDDVNLDVKPNILALAPFSRPFDFTQIVLIDDDEESFINANKPSKDYKFVNNLSFSKSSSSSEITYRCIPACAFKCSVLDKFKYHIERHVMIKLTGFCQICEKHVNKNISSLKEEVDHLEWHILNGNVVMPDPKPMKKRRMTTHERVSPRESVLQAQIFPITRQQVSLSTIERNQHQTLSQRKQVSRQICASKKKKSK